MRYYSRMEKYSTLVFFFIMCKHTPKFAEKYRKREENMRGNPINVRKTKKHKEYI